VTRILELKLSAADRAAFDKGAELLKTAQDHLAAGAA
jgi:hypothetical protein